MLGIAKSEEKKLEFNVWKNQYEHNEKETDWLQSPSKQLCRQIDCNQC